MATFYYNKSDKRYMNKSLTAVYNDVSLTYIDKTDISNPVLKLGKNIEPLNFNYVYIPEFNRYYYVSKPPTFEEGYYRVSLHVDVLMSFKTDLKKENVIVSRQEHKYNLYQNDERFKLYNYPATKTIRIDSGTGFNFNTTNYVLCVVGDVATV